MKMENKLEKKFPHTEKLINPVSEIIHINYLKSYITFIKNRENYDFLTIS